MHSPFRRRLTPSALGAALILVLNGCGGDRAAATVRLSGHAYVFNVGSPIAGARIRIAELSSVDAVTAADGSYELEVPNNARVTPFIVASGFATIHLQTFTTASADIKDANFQTPDNATFSALAAMLGVTPSPNGCVIVSTVGTKNLAEMSFQQFLGYSPHGVAGATVTSTPALPPPVYFNELVLPDPSLKTTSVDGGVVWTHVPNGIYTITAQAPAGGAARRFTSFVATCTEGRIINANPPWGLREL